MMWFRWVKEGRWDSVLGFFFFVGMMAVGYYYNITFIQLGLVDLGERLLGLPESTLALDMALMALLTTLTAVGFGFYMKRSSWGTDFKVKLRWAFAVILIQTVLTLAAPRIQDQPQLLIWILLTSLALGVGVPVTFSMTVDLIPVQDRGYAAAMITGLVYAVAPAASGNWQIETFSRQMMGIMPAGVIGLACLAFVPNPLTKHLKEQHKDPAFAHGLYSQQGIRRSRRRQLSGMILMMFGIFFVDSLGFLRIIDTPLYIHNNWLSGDLGPRLLLGAVHALAAFIAGVLYTNLDLRTLFLWVLGIFALVHLMYTMETRIGPGLSISLVLPLLYAVAVSLYTVINFTVWADLSTPKSISLNAALGVALSGWTATFLSTALSLQWRISGMSLERHLSLVDSLALLFFLLLLLGPYLPVGIGLFSED